MIERLIFSGFGGQGLLTAGKLLVACAMSEGKHVTYFPSYGSAVRGGTANCQMVVSDEPILSPVVERATALLMMNGPSMEKFLPRLVPGGLMVLNTSMVDVPRADGVRILGVRATEIAQEIGAVQVANVVLLSALNQITRMVDFNTLHEGLVKALRGRREALGRPRQRKSHRGRATCCLGLEASVTLLRIQCEIGCWRLGVFPMALERDIVEKIKQTFAREDAAHAIELLSAADKSGRIARCIVFAARGSVETLRHYLQLADEDFRDVIMAAEYKQGDHLRDFCASFLIDAPQKMWISEVAATLAKRDYTLSALETSPVNGDVVRYLCDLGEGTATFEGDMGILVVVKRGGQWRLEGDPVELERHDMSRAFRNETEFCDAVSGYILSKRRPLFRKP